MNRTDLETHVQECIDRDRPKIFLSMDGDPDARRQRLLGHHKGPYGVVVGHRSPCNVVMFNTKVLRSYLDQLPTHEFGALTDLACEISNEWTYDDSFVRVVIE